MRNWLLFWAVAVAMGAMSVGAILAHLYIYGY